MSTREEAIAQQVTWKSPELLGFAVAVVRRGVELYGQGVPCFSSDDVEVQPESNGTAGNAMTLLSRAHVIRHFWGDHPATGVFHGRRPSKRAGSKGAKIDVYELDSMAAAVEYLRRYGETVTVKQLELFGREA